MASWVLGSPPLHGRSLGGTALLQSSLLLGLLASLGVKFLQFPQRAGPHYGAGLLSFFAFLARSYSPDIRCYSRDEDAQ